MQPVRVAPPGNGIYGDAVGRGLPERERMSLHTVKLILVALPFLGFGLTLAFCAIEARQIRQARRRAQDQEATDKKKLS